ncbi:sodium-independent sulfate anion transporter-like [Convolutriloba macropyga]|uniref:sodium-independent sulfate anion transporter-like n=1 Tax=Convolutriloba macropyga TaxID=536237 RepID=UPI003F51AEE8
MSGPVAVIVNDGRVLSNHPLTVDDQHSPDLSVKIIRSPEVSREEADFISNWPTNPELQDDGDISVSAGCVGSNLCCCVDNFFTFKKRFPCVTWMRKYSWAKLLRDFIAGITVALTVVPQGIAYAKVAGLPAEYGLYSSYIGPLVYLVFGTAKDITMGPTAVMSLIVASYTKAGYPQYAVLLTFCAGVTQVLIGVFQLSILINFVSHPVISGFTSGAALTIAYGQVKSLLGNDKIDGEHLYEQVYQTFKYIKSINFWDTTLGLLCLIILLFLRHCRGAKLFPNSGEHPIFIIKFLRKLVWIICIASNAVVVISASVIVYLWSTVGDHQFSTVEKIENAGSVPFGVPPFGFHDDATNTTISLTEMVTDIKAGFLIVPLLGILESVAIAKAFARKNDYRIDTTQELFAIGLSNFASSFFNAYPVTGSFSRTAVNSQCNVATPLGGLFTSIVVFSALLFLSPLFQYIPESSLAALIISSIIFNFDYKIIYHLFKTKKTDFVTVVLTIVMCCLTSAEYGIIAGIVFSLLISLCPMARPRLRLERFRDGALVIARFDHGLNFPSAEVIIDVFSEHFEQIQKGVIVGQSSAEPKCCVIDLDRVWQIDQSVCASLATVKSYLEKKGVNVFLIRACPAVLSTLNRAKGREEMPRDWNHFDTLQEAISEFSLKDTSPVPLSNGTTSSKPEHQRETMEGVVADSSADTNNLANTDTSENFERERKEKGNGDQKLDLETVQVNGESGNTGGGSSAYGDHSET